MDDDKKSNQFDAALPLPGDDKSSDASEAKETEHKPDPATELIRQKIDAAYKNEPAAEEEIEEVSGLSQAKTSKHQKFIQQLLASGKSLADIQVAWHEYYQNLADGEKHEVWQEFYDSHAKAQAHAPAAHQPHHKPQPTTPVGKTIHHVKTQVAHRLPKTSLPRSSHLRSLLFGLGAGGIAVLIVLFGFFNERFIAPFIQPSRNLTNTPLISDATAIGQTPEIIIPKINVEIPVVYGVGVIDEGSVDTALESGVLHYADTALPGQNGNGVIVGHSSNNIFNKGKYKFAFVLLSRLESGDTFYLQKDGKRYTYQVYHKEIVAPENVSVLGAKDKPATFTLITCDPPGTSLKRLVVVGEQINPDPLSNAPQTTQNSLATQAAKIPGNSESLWHRLVRWFGR